MRWKPSPRLEAHSTTVVVSFERKFSYYSASQTTKIRISDALHQKCWEMTFGFAV